MIFFSKNWKTKHSVVDLLKKHSSWLIGKCHFGQGLAQSTFSLKLLKVPAARLPPYEKC
jgi:hypothetical protein